jgi:lipopolysaccharide/colanic/teichoic acid biosynthesis glycosyltransferase
MVAVPDALGGIWSRALNLGIALAVLVLFMPLFVLIAIAVRFDSRGPVLYRQVRVGLDGRSVGRPGIGRRKEDTGESPSPDRVTKERRSAVRGRGRRIDNIGGRPFVLYKFRTMKVDAEAETGPIWAVRDDPRVTRVGRWLRRYRLDELPQFLNVGKGDMAIVGPRPERPSLVRKLRRELPSYAARQLVPPGITGFAQVNRGADQTVEDVKKKLDYDLEYLGRRSVRFDLQIMLRTIPAMLRRR